MRILEFSPEDEIEGEMLFLQNKLLDNSLAIKHSFEDLLCRVVKKLPQELCAWKQQRWDSAFVSQYLREVRDVKQRGRKERRHQQAQAAATSSRNPLLRKDGNQDIGSPYPESPQMAENRRNQNVEDTIRSRLVIECGLCLGGSGAFRKARNGQWVHSFCAECNYGHCQVSFHPSCARTSSFYMNAKTIGGRFRRQAYCQKHSVEQRQKADLQQHGSEERKSIKQLRFELEKVWILCERIVKREKIKNPENFHKGVVMTSHQASMQNQRLPKGFTYIPRNSVSKETPMVHDSPSHDSEEPGG